MSSVDDVGLGLGHGRVLLGPVGALYAARAVAAAEATGRRDGVRPPANFAKLRQLLDQAAAEARSEAGHADHPAIADPPPSALVDPIGTAEAATILHVGDHSVRAACRRGAYASAQRIGTRWVMERGEVTATALSRARRRLATP